MMAGKTKKASLPQQIFVTMDKDGELYAWTTAIDACVSSHEATVIGRYHLDAIVRGELRAFLSKD